jgi:hypothetical protein
MKIPTIIILDRRCILADLVQPDTYYIRKGEDSFYNVGYCESSQVRWNPAVYPTEETAVLSLMKLSRTTTKRT